MQWLFHLSDYLIDNYYRKQFDRAIADFSRALEIDEHDPGAYHNRGCAYMMKGQYQKAIDDISRSIELDPSDPRVFGSRGNAYVKAGRKEEAIDDFRQMLSLTDEDELIRRAKRALKDLGEG